MEGVGLRGKNGEFRIKSEELRVGVKGEYQKFGTRGCIQNFRTLGQPLM